MEQLSTFELILLESNCEFSLISGTGPFKESQQRLRDKIALEVRSRPDFKEAVDAHLAIINSLL